MSPKTHRVTIRIHWLYTGTQDDEWLPIPCSRIYGAVPVACLPDSYRSLAMHTALDYFKRYVVPHADSPLIKLLQDGVDKAIQEGMVKFMERRQLYRQTILSTSLLLPPLCQMIVEYLFEITVA